MRLFVALELGPASDTDVAAPHHLTLRFLGEVGPEAAGAVERAIAEAARASAPFDLVLEGVGAFPSRARPRVVWVGATAGAAETTALAGRLAEALARVGFPAERERFVPHVTLFRVRSPGEHRRAEALLSGQEPPPPRRAIRVREVLLKASTLTREGATHRTLRAFPLGTDAPGG